jgi:iron complex transport system ATP-binding protein
VLLLREGRVHAAGPIGTTLTAEHLSATFGLPLTLERRDGRFSAFAR